MKKFVYDPKVEKNDSNVIRECYLELLHREPDTDSLDHFLNLFEKKQMNEKILIDNIKTSKEYKDKNNNSEIITRCYLELLHREPDTDSLDHFLNLFEKKQMNEKILIDNIKTSNEYLIKICYLQVFAKQIQEIDFEYYDNYIKQNKINHDELIDMMKKSDNYNKFNFRKLFSKKYLSDKEYYCR